MTILTDRVLRHHLDAGQLLVDPISDGAIQPSSIDLTLGDSLKRLDYGVTLDPERDQSDRWQDVALREDGRWMLGQHALYLGVTAETVSVPENMVALLHGVSSLGRLGLLIHVTAGLFDSGYSGRPTLEIVSLGGSFLLRPGMRIGQVTFHYLTGAALRPYRGRYLGDTAPTTSRSYQDTEQEVPA